MVGAGGLTKFSAIGFLIILLRTARPANAFQWSKFLALSSGQLRELGRAPAVSEVQGSAVAVLHSSRHSRALNEADCYSIMAPKVQQVAMLWLIMYEVHQEEVWTNWLRRLSGTVHEDIQCNEVIRKCYQDHVLTNPAKSVYDEQGWFTFYVHSKPDAPNFPEGSIFAGRTIRNRIETQWGTHTLTQATRLLLHAALANPLNQRFTLVCGSTLPVRPALFTYTQLMGESRSRFGIQQGWFTFYNPNWDPKVTDTAVRFPLPMHEEWPELKRVFALHNQFWVLIRKHAAIIDNDTFVEDLFARHCRKNRPWEGDVRTWCISDEQYVGTVLNHALREELKQELTVDPALLHLLSGRGLMPMQITPELIIRARNVIDEPLPDLVDGIGPGWSGSRTEHCHASEAEQFEVVMLRNQCSRPQSHDKEAAPIVTTLTAYPYCPVFARKFKEETKEKAAEVLEQLRIVTKKPIPQ